MITITLLGLIATLMILIALGVLKGGVKIMLVPVKILGKTVGKILDKILNLI